MHHPSRRSVGAIVLASLLPLVTLGSTGAAAAILGTRPVQKRATSKATEVRSRFTVTVPNENADLLVNDEDVRGTGTWRVFETAPLESARWVTYTISVRWRANGYTVMTRTRTVRFRGGETVDVDLTKPDPTDRAQIRWVPTPREVTDAMIQLAGVTSDDVAYEPGCGDARITIGAVQAGARRGVGIDINPTQVASATKRAQEAGLQDRIDIRLGDALDIKDLSNATVVFLYMGEEFDMLIRPILWQQLPVGARVVSHRFKMGDWEPDKTVTVWVEEPDIRVPYDVHLWTITEEIKKRAVRR